MEEKKAEKKAPEPAQSSGSGDQGFLAALCYIIGILVPLFVIFTDKKNDKFLLFHAYQSLLFTVALFVIFFAFGVLTMVVSVVSGGIGSLLSCLMLPIWLVAFVAVLYAAYRAYKGERYKLPVIGDMAEKYAR
ncbi:MAG: DUF4870 domain-containing protein [Candidatus ainarchaeum sp.]|nr:DUF4870 domain-containing protein [Candidatus ainarchaeum sp.]MDD5096001.1 DUF4870 domain-containing protein [Candidatus ainarchaeum sp.]